MKKSLFVALALLAMSGVAYAQNVTKQIRIDYTLPTVAEDGSPLTGEQALTKIQVFVSGAPIPVTSTAAPAAEATTLGTVINQSVTLPPGGTAYVRLKACNTKGCSVFSNESNVKFPLSVPGVPTNVVVTIVLQ